MANALTWSEQSTDVGQVLAALDRLRRSSERTATRTAIATLVVVAASDQEAAAATQVVDSLPGQPGRTVVLVLKDGDGMDAFVSVDSAEAAGHRVWREDVRLDISRAAHAHLDSFVDPLAFPDLPLVVWYAGGLPETGDALAAQANAVLVDSRHVGDGDREVLTLVAQLARQVPVIDLSWLRLEPWRSMTAHLFDAPGWRDCGGRISGAEVWGRDGPRRLLGGWLASRLDLDPTRIRLRPSEHAGLRLVVGDEAEFVVERVPEGRAVRAQARIRGGPETDRVLPLPPSGVGWSLVRALTRMTPDPVHLAALRAAAALPS